jgi:endonuclease YncB( thermonuclease family)
MSRVILFLLFFLAPISTLWSAPPQEIIGKAYAWDGDDLAVEGVRIRLHGIDAFELSQLCLHNGVPWQCGVEAKQALDALVRNHLVRCVLAQGRETHGRPVMRCYVGELELNAEMVKLGFALDCPRYSHGRYEPIQQEARSAARGAWAGTFLTPWASKGKSYCVPRSAAR